MPSFPGDPGGPVRHFGDTISHSKNMKNFLVAGVINIIN